MKPFSYKGPISGLVLAIKLREIMEADAREANEALDFQEAGVNRTPEVA